MGKSVQQTLYQKIFGDKQMKIYSISLVTGAIQYIHNEIQINT